jgi:hypothetical protein
MMNAPSKRFVRGGKALTLSKSAIKEKGWTLVAVTDPPGNWYKVEHGGDMEMYARRIEGTKKFKLYHMAGAAVAADQRTLNRRQPWEMRYHRKTRPSNPRHHRGAAKASADYVYPGAETALKSWGTVRSAQQAAAAAPASRSLAAQFEDMHVTPTASSCRRPARL